jgi:hypothetical protein
MRPTEWIFGLAIRHLHQVLPGNLRKQLFTMAAKKGGVVQRKTVECLNAAIKSKDLRVLSQLIARMRQMKVRLGTPR